MYLVSVFVGRRLYILLVFFFLNTTIFGNSKTLTSNDVVFDRFRLIISSVMSVEIPVETVGLPYSPSLHREV